MKVSTIALVLCLLGGMSCQREVEVGESYPGWKEGEMDIHHIYTGRGESNFLVLPDGTSLLIDAGDWDPDDYPKMCAQLPDSSRRSGEWIARYVNRVNPHKDKVDYLLISHFHNDHTGDSTNPADTTQGRTPNYVLTGIAEVGETIRFAKVYDRGYPDYQYPLPIQDSNVTNYQAFVKWQSEQYGLQQETFLVGKKNQIVLRHDPKRYDNNFSVQNLAANGEIWSGQSEETIRCYDLNPQNLTSYPNENTKSIALRIAYGPFSYYAGGDLSGLLLDEQGETIDIEERVAKVCGKVTVCKANHHAYLDAMTEGFIQNIQASHYVIPVWDQEHIQPTILQRIDSLTNSKSRIRIFPTHFPSHLRNKYAQAPWIQSVAPLDGHVVIKVYEHGKKYRIYILSPTDEKMTIQAIFGPYETHLCSSELGN